MLRKTLRIDPRNEGVEVAPVGELAPTVEMRIQVVAVAYWS